MARSNLVSSLILIVFGVVVAYESWRMPRFESIGGSIANAPGLVPGLLGVVIAFLGAVMLVRALAAGGRAAAPAPVEPVTVTASDASSEGNAPGVSMAEAPQPSNARLLATLIMSVVFAAGLVGSVPFWLAVFLFVAASIVYHERASLKDAASAMRLILIAVAIAGAAGFAVPFVFEKVFLVNLP